MVSNIIGSWEWVTEYTINQITGEKMYKTPQSEGYSKTLFFYSSGKYQLYKNAILNREYKYKIARLFEYTNYYLDSNLVLGLHNNIDNSFQIWYYVKPCNDSLVLDLSYGDGPVMTYIRN